MRPIPRGDDVDVTAVQMPIDGGPVRREATMPIASVVVCTHNRAALLPALIAALQAQRGAGVFEVLIVDSASSDATPACVADLTARGHPELRSLRLERPGLCRARNLGLEAAGGPIVVFIDDDALPSPTWLAMMCAAFDDQTVGGAGGPVRLRFEEPPPPWLDRRLRSFLTAYDLGREARRIEYTRGMEEYPRGANFAVRRSAALAAGGFRPLFERHGRGLRSNDELDLCFRMERGGWHLQYVLATVDHLVSRERLQPGWFLRRFAAQGESDALFEIANRGLRSALGRLRWYYARRLRFPTRGAGGAAVTEELVRECERREAWGYLRGVLWGAPLLLATGRDRPHQVTVGQRPIPSRSATSGAKAAAGE